MINLLIALSIMPIDNVLYKIQNETKCSVTITSGYRSVAHNKKVGGAKHSYHLTDRARDVVPKCDIKRWSSMACKYVSVIAYKTHVHIDNRRDKLCSLKY